MRRWPSAAASYAARVVVTNQSTRVGAPIIGGGFGSSGTSTLYDTLVNPPFNVTAAWHGPSTSNCRTANASQFVCSEAMRFRAPILAGYHLKDPVCAAHLDTLTYALPPRVNLWLDKPTAEAFLDVWWANPPSTHVLLHTRPPLDWARSRRQKFGASTNAPIDRPCAFTLGMFTDEQTATLYEAHNQLVRCIGNSAARLTEVDVFSEEGRRNLLPQMIALPWDRLLPPNSPLAQAHLHQPAAFFNVSQLRVPHAKDSKCMNQTASSYARPHGGSGCLGFVPEGGVDLVSKRHHHQQ